MTTDNGSREPQAKVERRPPPQDDKSWVTITMEAPIWMLWLSVVAAVATMVLLYLGGT